MLVVIEDVHWADRSTRDLLSFLFARPFRGPVVVLASYRSDDLHRRHPLRATVAQWVRVPGVHRVQLDPLADVDVRRLVRALLPGPLSESDLHAIVRRAEGNAFFAEELVSAAQGARGAGLPDDLADLLLVRLDRLDDGARAVVRAAACSGRRVSHPLLAAVVGHARRRAGAARCAPPSSRTSWSGSAPTATPSGTPCSPRRSTTTCCPGERVRLHAAYAEALRQHGASTAPPPSWPGTPGWRTTRSTAVRASVEAGDEAMSRRRPRRGGRALRDRAGAGRRPARLDADLDQVDLAVKAAEALVASGHPERAVQLVRPSSPTRPQRAGPTAGPGC